MKAEEYFMATYVAELPTTVVYFVDERQEFHSLVYPSHLWTFANYYR